MEIDLYPWMEENNSGNSNDVRRPNLNTIMTTTLPFVFEES